MDLSLASMNLIRIIACSFLMLAISPAKAFNAGVSHTLKALHGDSLVLSDSVSQHLTDSLINFALQYEGVPYRSGGTSKEGFDCSGFCSFVFKSFGMDLPRTSRDQSIIGKGIEFEDIRPGDLMFFKGSRSGTVGHVALVIRIEGDDIWMIHASSIRHRVVIDRYQDLGYYTTRYVGARRIIQSKEQQEVELVED